MKQKKQTLIILSAIVALIANIACAKINTITRSGKAYTPINSIAAQYNMKVSTSGKSIYLKNKWNTIEFEAKARKCWVNGTMLWLNTPLKLISSRWAIEKVDFDKLVDPVLRPKSYLSKVGSKIVVLDPGHGGKDSGAVSPRKVYEKLLVMDVAKRVQKRLKKRGITVKLTRESDYFLSLAERSRKAKKYHADLFVSIHADSAGSKEANGAGSYILSLPGCYSTHGYGQGTPSKKTNIGNKYDRENAILGSLVQKHLVKSTKEKDRGVKHARFQVLRDAPCPATLVEVAFLSNPKEEALVLKSKYREKIARGIADGIATYLSNVKSAKK